MDMLLELASLIGPTVAGLLTVPILSGIKRLVTVIDRAPAAVKQVLAILIAFGLTKLGELAQVALPGELSLFTGSDVEALLSAAIAFGVHAGQKARGSGNPTVKALSIIWLAFLPVTAACQSGEATVIVVDRSRLEVLVSPSTYTGELGDTLTFIAVARDTISGDTIPAQIRWTSTDETGVSVDPVTGQATLLRAGTFTVIADVTEIVSIVFLTQDDDGGWSERYSSNRHALYAARGFMPPGFELQVGEERPVCTYLETELGFESIPAELSSSDTTIVQVAGTGAGDNCPTWDGAVAGMSPMELYQITAFSRERRSVG